MSIPAVFSLYTSIFIVCEFRDVASENLSRLSDRAALIFALARVLVFKPFSKPLLHNPNRVQRTKGSVRGIIIEVFI